MMNPLNPDREFMRCDRCGENPSTSDGGTFMCLECGGIFCGKCFSDFEKMTLVCVTCQRNNEGL